MNECRCFYSKGLFLADIRDCPLHHGETRDETAERYAQELEQRVVDDGPREDGWGREWRPSPERLAQEREELRARATQVREKLQHYPEPAWR